MTTLGRTESMFFHGVPWLNQPVRKRIEVPVVLTIAGSDSGGGAGIQADLKTFAALGVHGTSAVTCITAQNPKRVWAIESCSPKIVHAQMQAVFSELQPRATKTGMLFSAEIIRTVALWFTGRKCPLVVDPVMIATSGASLLKPDAVKVLTRDLLPRATVVTPNAPEAEALLGLRIREPEDLRRAARKLHERFGCAALVKGGHLKKTDEAIDILFDGTEEWMLVAPRVPGVKTHGTGCTYAAAIAAFLARGETLERAVRLGKEFVTAAIATSHKIHGHDVLNHFAGNNFPLRAR
jgi:hydroxymethylpyrimidine kinase/phosphomethylpyrimidine kinase